MCADRWLWCGHLLWLLVATPAGAAGPEDCVAHSAAVHALAEASRTTGVAPLTVFLDATASSAAGVARPFHQLQFDWSFGDGSATTGPALWHAGARPGSRNLASGPVAAHVFEQPGVYRICLTVHDGGQMAQQSVTVHVLDAATVFPGRRTLCFSSSGNFSDAPAGSCRTPDTAITTRELAQVLAYAAPGVRLLLRRGETFTAHTEADVHVAGPGLLGAYGAQPAPPRLVAALPAGAVLLNFAPTASDWRVQDLELVCAGIAYCLQARDQVTLLRLQARDGVTGYAVSGDGSALVDSTFQGVGGHTSGYALYAGVSTRYFAAIGNTFDLAGSSGTQPTHVLRAWYLRKAVISDNTLRHAGDHYHLLKLHAPGAGGPGGGHPSEQVVIANNRFEGGSNPWMVVLGPQNAQVDERLRDILVQHNLFIQGAAADGAALVLASTAGDITVRDNVFDLRVAGGIGVLRDQPARGSPASARDVLHNTFRCVPRVPCTPIRSDSVQPPGVSGNLTTYAPDLAGPASAGADWQP